MTEQAATKKAILTQLVPETACSQPRVAVIDEDLCIGCTKCITACPFDTIVGAAKVMHDVLKNECTGCGLCVDPCPMDCITLNPVAQPLYQTARAIERYQARQQRLKAEQQSQQQNYEHTVFSDLSDKEQALKAKQDYIAAALQRVKAKKEQASDKGSM